MTDNSIRNLVPNLPAGRPANRRGLVTKLPWIGRLPASRNPAELRIEGSTFYLLDDASMAARTTPVALVEGMIPERSLAVIYGQPASGKSFLALDLAYSVATGIPWLGRKVQHGPAVYIAGEGIGGLPKRIAAWKDAHGAQGGAEVHFLPEVVRLLQRNAVDQV